MKTYYIITYNQKGYVNTQQIDSLENLVDWIENISYNIGEVTDLIISTVRI